VCLGQPGPGGVTAARRGVFVTETPNTRRCKSQVAAGPWQRQPLLVPAAVALAVEVQQAGVVVVGKQRAASQLKEERSLK